MVYGCKLQLTNQLWMNWMLCHHKNTEVFPRQSRERERINDKKCTIRSNEWPLAMNCVISIVAFFMSQSKRMEQLFNVHVFFYNNGLWRILKSFHSDCRFFFFFLTPTNENIKITMDQLDMNFLCRFIWFVNWLSWACYKIWNMFKLSFSFLDCDFYTFFMR